MEEPEKPALKEWDEEPERPSGLRRFLCEHFSFFDRLLGKKVHDYDQYVADQAENRRKTEEYDRKMETYNANQEEQRAYRDQINNAQTEIYPERGLYQNNSNIPELRSMAEQINSVVGDKYTQVKMMDDMYNPDKHLDENALRRLNRKNVYLRQHQTRMARPGMYAPDGTLTEAGAKDRENEHTHLPDLEESLTRNIKEVKNPLGNTVNFVKNQVTREMYAKYFYLRRVQNECKEADEAHRREMMGRIAPWNLAKGTNEILEDPAFAATLEVLENKNATAEDVFTQYETLSKETAVPRKMGREQFRTMSGMAPNSQAKLVMKLGQVGFMAAIKSGTEGQPTPDRDQIVAMASSTLLQNERTANGGQPGPLEQSLETVGVPTFVKTLLDQPGVKEKVTEWEKNWPDPVNSPDFLKIAPETVETFGKALENEIRLQEQAVQTAVNPFDPEVTNDAPALY